MSNPILEGIVAGNTLAGNYIDRQRQRRRDITGDEQFDRVQTLNREKFTEGQRVQKRAENQETAKTWRSKLHAIKQQFNNPEIGDKDKQVLGQQFKTVFDQGMASNAYIKEVLGTSFEAATGRGLVSHDTGEELTELKMAVDSNGNPIVGIGNSAGEMATVATGKDDTVPGNKGQPWTASPDELMDFMDGSFNEALKSEQVSQSMYDERVDKETQNLQDLDTQQLGASSARRKAQSAWQQNQGANVQYAGGLKQEQPETEPEAAAGTPAYAGTGNEEEQFSSRMEYQTVQDKQFGPKLNNSAATTRAAGALFKKDPKKGRAAVEKQLEYLKVNRAETEKRYGTGARIDGHDSMATQQQWMERLLASEIKEPSKTGLAGASNAIKNKVAEGRVTPSDVKTPKQQHEAYLLRDKELEAAYNNAVDAEEKATLAQKRGHIAALIKLKVSTNAKDVTNIMNNGGASYYELARIRAMEQTATSKSQKANDKYRTDEWKGVERYLKTLTGSVVGKYRQDSAEQQFVTAITQEYYNNPYMVFNQGDAAGLWGSYKDAARYVGKAGGIMSINLAKTDNMLKARGFLTDMDDEDRYEFVQGYVGKVEQIAQIQEMPVFEVVSSINQAVLEQEDNDPSVDKNTALLNAFNSFSNEG